jgi:hypothetical protein
VKTTAAFGLPADVTLTAAAVARRLRTQPTRALKASHLVAFPGDLWLDVCGAGTDEHDS